MSASGHTDSDGAKPHQCRFLFKKLRIGALVFLALVLTITGTVWSTRTFSIEPEGGYDSEKNLQSIWEAKQLLKMLARCVMATKEVDDVDTMQTKEALYDGKWFQHGNGAPDRIKEGGATSKYTPKVDALAGRNHTVTCYSTFTGNKGLIAATVDALNAIADENKKIPGTWSSWNNEDYNGGLFRKASILRNDLGLVAYTQQGKNKSVNSAMGEDNNWSGEENIVNPLINDYDRFSDKSQLYLDPVDNISVNDIINNLWGRFRSDKWSDDEIGFYYRTFLNGLTKGCTSTAQRQTTRPDTTNYEILEIPVIYHDNNTPRLVTEYLVKDKDNSVIENFYAENQTVAWDSWLTQSCTDKTTMDKFRALSREYLKERLIATGDVKSCLSAYKQNLDAFENNRFQSESKAKSEIASAAEELPFSDTKTSQEYHYYISELERAGQSKQKIYLANKSYLDRFKQEIDYDNTLDIAARKITLNANKETAYDSSPYKCYDESKDAASRLKCNINLMNGSEAQYIVQNSEYEVIREAMEKVLPVYKFEVVEAAMSKATDANNVMLEKIESLQSPDSVEKQFYATKFVSSINSSLGTGLNVFTETPDLSKFGKNSNGSNEGPIYYTGDEFACVQQEYLDNNLKNPESTFLTNLRQAVESVGGTMQLDGTTTGENPETNMEDVAESNGSFDLGGGGYDLASTCEGNALMGWILCPIIKGVTGGASWLYHSAIEGSLQMNSDELAANNTGAHQAWGYFVNFANVILIILFLFVIFSQLTGYGIDNYGIKRVLPKLIVVAILINLSFIICQLAVDVTNILGHSFESLFDSIKVAKNASIENSKILDEILGWLLGGIGLGVTVVAGVYVVRNVRNLLTGLLIPVLLAILVALIAVLFFFILLGVRRAGIIALIVVSPVAIVCYALPNTKKYFDKWFNGLKALLVVYPVCGLMLGMSRLIARLISSGNEDFISNLVAMAVLVYPFFVIPTLVSRAISAVTSLGEKISQLGRGIRRRTSDGIKNTERYKEAQERRKAAEEARRGTRRAAIDARRRARTGQPDGAATQSAEAARRDAIKTLSDPNASLTDRRRAQRELRRADRALAAAQWYQKSEDNYLAKQKEAQETAARAGYQGDYVATMDASQGRAIQNAFNIKIADAEQLAREVNIDLARERATARQQSEEYKAYAEQFGQKDKKGLIEAAVKARDKFASGEGDINELQAAVDLLLKSGYHQEALELFDGMQGNTWNTIRSSESARSSLMGMLAKAGDPVSKGYSKYLAEAKENAVSFSEWQANGDSTLADRMVDELVQKDDETDAEFAERKAEVRKKAESLQSLESYERATFSNNDMLANADKDTLKYLRNKAKKGELGGAITPADLTRASASKTGEELTVINNAIAESLSTMVGANGDTITRRVKINDKGMIELDGNKNPIIEYLDSNGNDLGAAGKAQYETAYKESISDYRISNENFSKLELSTWNALTNGSDPILEQAFREKFADQIKQIQGDKRIWNKISPEVQAKLDPTLVAQQGQQGQQSS